MEFKFEKKAFILTFIFLILFLFTGNKFANSSLFFNSVNINLGNNTNLFYNLTIDNSENKVIANNYLKIKIVNSENGFVYFDKYQNFSFYNYEVKFVNGNINIKDLPNGKYLFLVYIYEKTGTPVAGFEKDFIIRNNNNLSNKAKYLNLASNYISGNIFILAFDDKNKSISSHGLLGVDIKPTYNLNLAMKFYSSTPLNFKKNLKINVKLFKAHSINTLEYETTSNLKFISNESIGLVPINYHKPDAYNVLATIYYNNTKLFSKTIRLVISGVSGSILNVLNSKDVYKKGDYFNVSGLIVGPADGATILKNVVLKLKVDDKNNHSFLLTKNYDTLGFHAKKFEFIKKLDYDLTNYKITISLIANNTILDNVTLSYKKLNPKFFYKNGVIYNTSKNVCKDDGICTPEEKKLGNCEDCYLVTLKKNTQKINQSKKTNTNNKHIEKNLSSLIIILFVIIISLIILTYLIYRGLKNEK